MAVAAVPEPTHRVLGSDRVQRPPHRLSVHLLELGLELVVEEFVSMVAQEAEQLALLRHASVDAGFSGGESDGRFQRGLVMWTS